MDRGLPLAANERLGAGDGVGLGHQLGAVEGDEAIHAGALLVVLALSSRCSLAT